MDSSALIMRTSKQSSQVIDRISNMQSLKPAEPVRGRRRTGLRSGRSRQESGSSGRSTRTWNLKPPIQDSNTKFQGLERMFYGRILPISGRIRARPDRLTFLPDPGNFVP